MRCGSLQIPAMGESALRTNHTVSHPDGQTLRPLSLGTKCVCLKEYPQVPEPFARHFIRMQMFKRQSSHLNLRYYLYFPNQYSLTKCQPSSIRATTQFLIPQTASPIPPKNQGCRAFSSTPPQYSSLRPRS